VVLLIDLQGVIVSNFMQIKIFRHRAFRFYHKRDCG